jgi:hypothetical protein
MSGPHKPGGAIEVTTEVTTELAPLSDDEVKVLRMRLMAVIIREHRSALRLTQAQVAERATALGAHVSSGHIARMESQQGIVKFDDLGYFRLGAILAALGMTHADLEREVLSRLYRASDILERLAEEGRRLSSLYAVLPQEERETLLSMAEHLAARAMRRPFRTIAAGWSAGDVAQQREGLRQLDAELRRADELERGRRVRNSSGGIGGSNGDARLKVQMG